MKSDNNDKMFFYDNFAENFDDKMNMYDLNKRLALIFGKLLNEDINGKALLDAGSGTGWFSKEAAQKGAQVFSLDVGNKILAQVAKKCDSKRVVGSVLDIPFPDNFFDIVISTEVIEHTTNPRLAIQEIYRVLKFDGVLVLTVPNKIWHPAVFIANTFKMRPYEGYENWVGWHELKRWLSMIGFAIDKMEGLHLFPFIFPCTHGLLSFMDRFSSFLGPIMLNICVKAIKR